MVGASSLEQRHWGNFDFLFVVVRRGTVDVDVVKLGRGEFIAKECGGRDATLIPDS